MALLNVRFDAVSEAHLHDLVSTGVPEGVLIEQLQRLDSLARDGIEPRIVGIRMKAMSVSGAGVAFVIRIPKSWNPPHRVSARMTNRIYARKNGSL